MQLSTHRSAMCLGILILTGAVPVAWGWGAEVHRNVVVVALERLPENLPAWLRSSETSTRVAFHSNQPDRWRGWRSDVLRHVNDPEHYINIERLVPYGLTLETLPPLRREYVRALVIAKHEHADAREPYDPATDPARAREWPGFLPHALAEHYAKLQAALHQVQILERIENATRAEQLAEARAIAVYHLGMLAHFVADAAQPLHTTHHFNGWVGANPAGYTWRENLHQYIDVGVVRRHQIDGVKLRAAVRELRRIDAADVWRELLALIHRAHAEVEPLYVLERDGELDGPAGAELITARLVDAAATLGGLIQAAYESSTPTEQEIERWVYYDDFDGHGESARATTQPTRSGS